MNPELIARVIALVGEHNDHVVLADPQNGKTVVVMDLSAYERLLRSANAAANSAELSYPQPAVYGNQPSVAPVAYQPPAPPQYQPPAPPQYQPPAPPQYQPPVPPSPQTYMYGNQQPSSMPSPAAYQPPAAPFMEPTPPPVRPAAAAVNPPVESRSERINVELTQEELLEKINREIGAWKSAQERRRSDELKSGVTSSVITESRQSVAADVSRATAAPRASRRATAPAKPETANNEFEEERFYLEPIE